MGNRQHTILQSGRRRILATSELPAAELRRLLDHPDQLLWQNLHRPVKIDHDSLMVEAQLPLLGGPVHVAYKRYGARNWWKSFCGMFRRSRARRAWHLGHALLERQIPTARPLAMSESGRFRLPQTSYLATEWIQDAENLHLAAWRWAHWPGRRRLRRAARCGESLGRLLGRMHTLQIAHRDLKAANLLVVEDGRRMASYLIDLDGVRIRRRLSPRRRAANLARLAAGLEAHPWISRTVCCRFLRAYAGQFSSGEVDWKRLWRDVAARSHLIVQRKRRRSEQVL